MLLGGSGSTEADGLAGRARAATQQKLKQQARRRAVAALRKQAAAAAGSSSWWLWVVLAAAVLAGLLVVGLFVMLLASGGDQQRRLRGRLAASGLPPVVVAAYQQAATGAGFDGPGCQVPAAVLAGIGKVESAHGTHGGSRVGPRGWVAPPIIGVRLDGSGPVARVEDTDGGRLDGDTQFDRAVGPMQFLPGSWQTHGRDANRDGRASPQQMADAAAGAAVHLCSGHAGQQLSGAVLREALYGYNPSTVYVDQVLEAAASYETAGQMAVGYGGSVTGGKLLANPRVTAGPLPARDLRSGRVHPKVLGLVAWIARSHTVHISSLKSGHSKYVADTDSISLHFLWRGVDISHLDGRPVSASNTAAAATVDRLAAMGPASPLKPDEVGSPFGEYSALPGFFTDADHQGHLHFGYEQKGE